MSNQITLVQKVDIVYNGVLIKMPQNYKDAIKNLIENKNGYAHITFGTPQKDKSTGARSENNFIHGSCYSIALQLGYVENRTKSEATDYVKNAMKRLAVGERGYPSQFNDIDGYEEPMSLARASSEQAQMVINTILDFCSIHDLWLIAYDDDEKPFKYMVRTGEIIEEND